MSENKYEKGSYYEPELQLEKGLEKAGIKLFQYYPEEKLVVVSDYIAKMFNGNKYVVNVADNAYLNLVAPEHRQKVIDLFHAIDDGAEIVNTKVQSLIDTVSFEITFAKMGKDEQGRERVIAAVVSVEENIRYTKAMTALSNNFENVYYVDVAKNEVTPITVNQTLRNLLSEKIDTKPKYEDIMRTYVERAVLKEDRERVLAELDLTTLKDQLKEKDSVTFDYRVLRDGKIRFYRAKYVNVSEGDELVSIVAGFADVNSQKEKELERLAFVDPITGGSNYEAFKRQFGLTPKQSGYLISMDVHEFKIINSICGIETGNETLKGIWNVIRKSIKEQDIAGHVNADRFVIYTAAEDEEALKSLLEEIKTRLSLMSERYKIPILVPYFGVAKYTVEQDIEQIHGEANFAKNQIKNRQDVLYQIYSEKDALKILEDKEIEDAFLSDLEKGRFEVWYQPKYNPHTENLIGAEALVRWRKADGSLVSPGKFIPLFEKNGMIRTLDQYVFATVCGQQLRWRKEGKKIVPVSVNLSRATLYYDSVVTDYKNIAEENGIESEYVPIEITESAAVDNDNIHVLAKGFHQCGFSLLVDDFGSGYSSLAMLNMGFFDVLKIDKSLIDHIGDHNGERLLDHTITLAKEIGLYITAEGVETVEQVEFLRAMNCDSIQGYYYSKPLPMEEFSLKLGA